MLRSSGFSWRAGVETDARLLRAALYVRDACRLPVPSGPSSPPELIEVVADHSGELSAAYRLEAALQWVTWFQAIVALEGAMQRGTLPLPLAGPERLDAWIAAEESLLDWPELEALRDVPALQQAVRVSYPDLSRVGGSAQLEGRSVRRQQYAATVRSAAEALIERLGISPSKLSAGILIISVRGLWTSIPEPGVLCCSVSAAEDVAQFARLIERAFISGLDAPDTAAYPARRRVHSLPPSILARPVGVFPGPSPQLVLNRVIPYKDGFELELRRTDGEHSSQGDSPQGEDRFSGLELEMKFSDGRRALMPDVASSDAEGELVLSRFLRGGRAGDSLWVWVMPLPPDGDVTLGVRWPEYDCESQVRFQGGSVRSNL
jgi:hypothetical protein